MAEKFPARRLHQSARKLFEKRHGERHELSIPRVAGAIAVISATAAGVYEVVVHIQKSRAARQLNVRGDLDRITLTVGPDGVEYQPPDARAGPWSPLSLEQHLNRTLAEAADSEPVDTPPAD